MKRRARSPAAARGLPRTGGAPPAVKPTDARIRQEICARLADPVEDIDMGDLANEHVDVSGVRVSVAGGKVVLEGTVPERRMKPYIEALVDACPGVQDIDNRLRVRR